MSKDKKKPDRVKIVRHLVYQVLPDNMGMMHHLPDEKPIQVTMTYHRSPDTMGFENTLELEWEES